MDRICRARRSWNMGRVRGRDTGPELIVRKVLHRMGLRFRLQRRDLPGRPDVVLPRWRTIVFIHGCFWHRHEQCRFAYVPKTRTRWWLAKFAANVERDVRARERLQELGWRVITVWECETSDTKELSRQLLGSFSREV